MYVDVYVCQSICLSAHMYICLCLSVYTYVCICVSKYVHMLSIHMLPQNKLFRGEKLYLRNLQIKNVLNLYAR